MEGKIDGVLNEAFVSDDVDGQPQAPLPTPSIVKVKTTRLLLFLA